MTVVKRSTKKKNDSTKDKSTLKETYKPIAPNTKLTPELVEKICSYLEGGNYIETACNMCYIHKTTYFNWIKRAEEELEAFAEAYALDHDTPARFSLYVDFYLRARESEASAEVDDIRAIRNKLDGWQGRAWIREHRRGRTDWTRPTGATAQPTTTNVNILNVTGDDIGKALAAHDAQIIEQAQYKQLDT